MEFFIPRGGVEFPEFVKVGFTQREFVKKVLPNIKDNASNCDTKLFRRDKRYSRFLYRTKCHESYSGGPHTSRVMFIRKSSKSKGKGLVDVKVSCNCSGFLYWGGMYNNLQQGTLALKRKRVKPPNIRDPERRNVVGCKHVFNALLLSMGYQNKFLKEIQEERAVSSADEEREDKQFGFQNSVVLSSEELEKIINEVKGI